MNAPVLPTQRPPTVPALKSSSAPTPHRPWKELSQTAKAQLASIIAEMVKRKAAAREDQNDAGDHHHA